MPSQLDMHSAYSTQLYRRKNTTETAAPEKKKFRFGVFITLFLGLFLLYEGISYLSLAYKPDLFSQFGNLAGGTVLVLASGIILLVRLCHWAKRPKAENPPKTRAAKEKKPRQNKNDEDGFFANDTF